MKHVNRISNLDSPNRCLLSFFLAFSSILSGRLHAEADPEQIPTPSREFRAAWVATVANIDWPSKKGLSSSEQQDELLAIFDRAVKLNLNAIVFQVRPHCDAIYASELEPWSEYLSGTMGKPPEPYYDPLAFAVRQAHLRGLELHAWFNPYRALHPGSNRELAAKHVNNIQPQIVRQYGKHLWLDPGEKEAADHNVAVILDVVNRYDIDGIHFDDYFYPYPIQDETKHPSKQRVPFPDDPSWQKAEAAGNTLGRDDWRRQNVDRLIRRLTDEIHAAKPWVKFGISPFGIWRPGHPPGIKGFDAYTSLYADAKKWWNEGWVDYLTPQLYWKIESPGQSYPKLLQWWHEENRRQRHLWPGNFTSRVASGVNASGVKGNWPAAEIINQIQQTRVHPGAGGNVHFSMKALMEDDRGVAEAMAEGPYRQPALIPASPWLGKQAPQQPLLNLQNSSGERTVQLALPEAAAPWLWVIRTFQGNRWLLEIAPGHVRQYALVAKDSPSAPLHFAVSAVSRLGVEGPMTELELSQ